MSATRYINLFLRKRRRGAAPLPSTAFTQPQIDKVLRRWATANDSGNVGGQKINAHTPVAWQKNVIGTFFSALTLSVRFVILKEP